MAAARAPRVSCWYPGDPPINERLHNHWVVNWGKKRTKLGPDGQSKLRSLAQSVLNGPYADDGNLWLNEDAFCQTFIALFLQYGCVVHHTLVNQQPVIDVYQLDPNLLQEHQVPWPTWDQFKIDLIQHVASAQAICQNNGIAEFDWYAAINKAGLAAFQIIGYRMRPIRSLQGWTEYDRLLDTLSQNPTWLDKLDELALAFSRSQAFARATAMGKISTEGTGRFVDPGCLSPNRKALKALFNIQDDGAWDTFRKHTWPAFSDALVRRAVYLQRRDRELGLIYTDPEIGNDLNLLSTATGRLADPEQQYEKPKTEGWTEFGAQKLSPVRQWFKTKLASSRERLHEEEPVIGTILKSATKDQYFNLNRTLNAVQPRNVAPGPAAGAHILGQVAQPEPDLDKDMRNLAAGEKFVHDIREQAADEIEFNFAAEVDMDLDLERILNESASNSEEDEADDRENALPPAAMPTATARDLRAWMVAVEADELFIQTKKWEDVRVLLAALDVASTHGKPGWTASRDQRCFSRGISERSEERLRAKGYVPARVVSALNEEAFLDSWWCINQLLELHPEHLTQDEREDLRQDMALLIAFASVSKIPSLYAQGFDVLLDLYGVRVTKRAKDSGLKTHPEALNLLYGITQLGITCYLSVMCGNRSTGGTDRRYYGSNVRAWLEAVIWPEAFLSQQEPQSGARMQCLLCLQGSNDAQLAIGTDDEPGPEGGPMQTVHIQTRLSVSNFAVRRHLNTTMMDRIGRLSFYPCLFAIFIFGVDPGLLVAFTYFAALVHQRHKAYRGKYPIILTVDGYQLLSGEASAARVGARRRERE